MHRGTEGPPREQASGHGPQRRPGGHGGHAGAGADPDGRGTGGPDDRRNGERRRGRAEGEPSSPDWSALLDEARDELARLVAELLRIARLRWHRARLRAREGFFGAVLVAWLALFVAAATVVGAVQLVLGLSDAVGAATGGRPWAGRLFAGAAVLGAGWLVLRWARTRMRRAFLRDVRRRMEPEPGTGQVPRGEG